MQKNEFIKQIRAKYKMSQKKFAEYLEVSKSLIEKVEMGKVSITPENKYVKAVCALEGLDNEIFKFDEITDEILKEYELTKFSKAFRKFLFFYYGDFWNEDILVDITNVINSNIGEYLAVPTLKEYITKEEFNEKIEIIKQKIFDFCFDEKIDKLKISNLNSNKQIVFKFIQITIVLALNKFKPSYFIDIIESIKFIEEYKENIIISIINYPYYDNKNSYYSISLITNEITNKLKLLENQGLPLTIENIRKLKKQKELENIKDEIQTSITDPKDKEICELLQYAPPAFKDKIIEKLKKFRDEVEDI